MPEELARAAQPGHTLDPSIFREYDIRGVVGQTLFPEGAYLIARAFATKAAVAQPDGFVCVGRDGRTTSPEMADAVCRGVSEAGMNVVDIGVGPTPMLYYTSATMKAAGGIMVTGSHNPPDHNGFKFVFQGKPFFGDAIRALHGNAQRGDFTTGKGRREDRYMLDRYVDALVEAYEGPHALNVAWDAGNGATGAAMTKLSGKLPGMHMLLNERIDGTFPSHHPDPSVAENMQQLIKTVQASGLDVGIAFDGDGDRIGVVDDEGVILWGDQLLMILAADVLAENSGATIIADVKASSVLFDEIKKHKGVPLMWKTGHSLIKSKMAETGALLAGEMSGHIFFADRYFGFDDALYAAVRVLSVLARSGRKLSEYRKALPVRVNTPEIRFPCDEARKFEVIAEVKERLMKEGADFSDIDGVRVNTPDGWWLLRASNTQAVLVARCESSDKAGLIRLQKTLADALAKSGLKIQNF